MGHLSKQAKAYFTACGKKGGDQRKNRLSSAQRSYIASNAARSRWSKNVKKQVLMPSIRLERPDWSNPVYLEEILAEGGMREWQTLYYLISERPFGDIANVLESVVASTYIYGATHLWRSLLMGLRGVYDKKEK